MLSSTDRLLMKHSMTMAQAAYTRFVYKFNFVYNCNNDYVKVRIFDRLDIMLLEVRRCRIILENHQAEPVSSIEDEIDEMKKALLEPNQNFQQSSDNLNH